jgi:hypothetical protein
MLREAGWRWCSAEGDWSYRSNSGVTSSVDHLFVRGAVEVAAARYLADGIVGVGPLDHAALVVDVQRCDEATGRWPR